MQDGFYFSHPCRLFQQWTRPSLSFEAVQELHVMCIGLQSTHSYRSKTVIPYLQAYFTYSESTQPPKNLGTAWNGEERNGCTGPVVLYIDND